MKPGAKSRALEVFSNVPSFSGVTSGTLAAIAQGAVPRSYDEGQMVFLEGEPCSGLFIVQEGWLKSVKLSTTGREQVIRFVGPGESFNEISVFAGTENLVTVIALENSRLWLIPRQDLLQLIEEYPDLCEVVIKNLAQRTLHLMSLVEDLSLRPVEARLARFLLEQAEGDLVSRRQWSTQAQLSSRLGTVPDVLNRVLRSLVEAGLIQLERQQIKIIDRAGLESKAMLGN